MPEVQNWDGEMATVLLNYANSNRPLSKLSARRLRDDRGTMQRFIIERNVATFFARLQTESDPAARDIMRRLMIEEEDKFGKRSEKLELLERYIEDCRARIAQVADLDVGPNGQFPDRELAAQLVDNLTKLATNLEQYRAQLERMTDGGL